MKTKEDILKACTVDGLIVKLPNGKLDRNLYLDVAESLKLIGGKWKGGKIAGFIFQEDPTELLTQIAKGGNRNLKKEFQFFGTPEKLADKLVSIADIKNSHKILEPSAGQGAIVDAIVRKISTIWVDCCEIMAINGNILAKHPNVHFICEDFLKIPKQYEGYYDRIIANPPFSKNQDIDHVMKMYSLLKKGGMLVSITSKHWETSNNRKEKEFRDWLVNVTAYAETIPAGEFKESGTEVGGKILIINKK